MTYLGRHFAFSKCSTSLLRFPERTIGMQYMHADLRGYLSIFENIRCNSVLKPLALSPLRRAHKWLKLRMFLKIYFRGYLSIFENIRCNSVLKPLALSPLRRAHKWLKLRMFLKIYFQSRSLPIFKCVGQ